MKIINDFICEICNNNQENIFYIFRDCEFVYEFWGKWDILNFFFNYDLKDWFSFNFYL